MNLPRISSVALVIFLAGCASSPKVTGAIEWRGIYSVSVKPTRQVDTSSPTGFRQVAGRNVILGRATNSIPASVGTKFGIQYWVLAGSRDAVREIVWKFPSPGVRNPHTNQVFREHRIIDNQDCGQTSDCIAGYTFDEQWEAVPGEWVVEIVVNGRTVLSSTFEVVAN